MKKMTEYKKKVTKFGSRSAHIIMPIDTIGEDASVFVLKKRTTQ